MQSQPLVLNRTHGYGRPAVNSWLKQPALEFSATPIQCTLLRMARDIGRDPGIADGTPSEVLDRLYPALAETATAALFRRGVPQWEADEALMVYGVAFSRIDDGYHLVWIDRNITYPLNRGV